MIKTHHYQAALSDFDPEWYYATYQDVALSGLSPEEHYRKYGIKLGRKPNSRWFAVSACQVSQSSALLPYVSINQMQPVTDLPGTWISEGDDPHWYLDMSRLPVMTAGWYQMTMQIDSKAKRGLAKAYFDLGRGLNEQDTLQLPFYSGEAVSRVFYIDNTLQNLRLDPCEREDEISVQHFALVPINADQLHDRLLRALIQGKPCYQDHTCYRLQEQLNAELPAGVTLHDHLWQLYQGLFTPNLSAENYETWIENIERPSLPNKEAVLATINAWEKCPTISLVIPVYNTDEMFLRACIDSVRQQSYSNWQLCIADDNSPKPHIKRILKEYTELDERIQVVYRSDNGHISAASNSALDVATGEYVALIDHDDALPEHALFFVVDAINKNPSVAIIYSDEDKITEQGERFDPHFKSDWNPDLFFSQNYVSHLGVYRRSLLNKISGFRIGVEGSQDQDLLLRCLQHVSDDQIIHIPRILYHWRTVTGSTALASGEKSYTTEAGIKALRDYFSTVNPAVQVSEGLVPNTYRVSYPIPDPAPLVSLLIPTRDRRSLTEIAVRSILEKSTYTNYEILILDNGSVEQETLEFFEKIQREDNRVRVLRYDHPFNYSAINNFGARHAKGSVIGLVNNDIEVISPEWLTEMVSHCMRPEIGCVGAKLYYSNDTIQHGGVILGIGGVAGHSHKHFPRNHPGYFSRLLLTQSLSAVTAACLLVMKDIFDCVSGLDERNLHVAFNDIDFCLKVRTAGYRNIWSPYAELYHHESVSRGTEDNPDKIARFNREVEFMKMKWGDGLANDPYYSVNLTKDKEDFSVGN